MKAIKVWWLKRRARKLLLAYGSNYSDMSCGAHLGRYIRGSDRGLIKRFNSTMDRLAELDPNCPDFRLEES